MFLQWFQVFSGVIISVSDACFTCLHMYVASIAFEYFKSRSGLVSSSSLSAASSRCLLLATLVGHPPLPPSLLNARDVQGMRGPHVGVQNGAEK